MSNMKNWKNIVQSANLRESDSEDANYTDHEVSMAKSQLLSSVKSSTRIAKHLSDKSEDEGIPGWVASKLTVAEDYLQAVADYMDGEELQEGYKVMPPMDPKYVERKGLEGPFTTLSGKVVYYDPKEGSYYDPDTDMYISYDEFQDYDNDYSDMKDENDEVEEGNEFSGALANAKKSGKKEFNVGGKTYQVENYQDRYNAAASTRNAIKVNKSNASMPQDAVRKVSGDSSYTHANNPAYKAKANARKNDGLGQNADVIKRMKPNPKDGKFIWGRDTLTDGVNETKYGIVRYPDTAISYIKNDGNGWEHIFDKSYGFEGPVDKEDLKYAKKIAKEKIPSRMFEATDTCECGCDCGKAVCESCGKKHSIKESTEMMTEAQFDEAAGEKDACYRKVKSRYKVWPSAYASGALVKCRKVGAKNWGNSKK